MKHILIKCLASYFVSASYEYGAFGETISVDGGAVATANLFRYSTKYLDVETGLYNYGYRYYDSVNGRWLSRDLMGEEGGMNLYGFVANNPVNKVDYLGLTTVGEVLNSYFTNKKLPDPGDKLWVMNANDRYTEVVKSWEVVKKWIQTAKKDIVLDPQLAKRQYKTFIGWVPLRTGYMKVPQARKYDIPDPEGTGWTINAFIG